MLARLGLAAVEEPRRRTVIGSLKFTSAARLTNDLRLMSFGLRLTARSSFARSALRALALSGRLDWALAPDTGPSTPRHNIATSPTTHLRPKRVMRSSVFRPADRMTLERAVHAAHPPDG